MEDLRAQTIKHFVETKKTEVDKSDKQSLMSVFRLYFTEFEELLLIYKNNPRLRENGSTAYKDIKYLLNVAGYIADKKELTDNYINLCLSKIRKERGLTKSKQTKGVVAGVAPASSRPIPSILVKQGMVAPTTSAPPKASRPAAAVVAPAAVPAVRVGSSNLPSADKRPALPRLQAKGYFVRDVGEVKFDDEAHNLDWDDPTWLGDPPKWIELERKIVVPKQEIWSDYWENMWRNALLVAEERGLKGKEYTREDMWRRKATIGATLSEKLSDLSHVRLCLGMNAEGIGKEDYFIE